MPNKTKKYSVLTSMAAFLSLSGFAKAQWTASSPADQFINKRPLAFEIMESLTKVSGYIVELSSFFVLYGILSYVLTADKKRRLMAKKIFYLSCACLALGLLVWIFAQFLLVDPMI